MNKTTQVVAIAALLAVLCAAADAAAHKAHQKQAEGSVEKAPAAAEPVPAALEPVPEAADPEPAPAPVTHQVEPHDHQHAAVPAHDSPEAAAASNVPKPLAWLGKFHPAATHFPIALLIAGALAELLFVRRGDALFEHAARFCVWLGAGAALLTAVLGWLFAGFQLVDDEWVMTAHRWAGTSVAFWAAGLLVLCERANRGTISKTPFRVALLLGAVLVGATGFLGGSLLYGLDHFAW